MSGTQTQISEALRRAGAGDLAGAERICAEVVRREPNNVSAVMLAGIIAANRGDNDKAAPFFERAIALQPQRADAHYNLGLVRDRQGRNEEALAAFERALKIDPNNVEASVARANALLMLLRWPEAIAALDRILAAHPGVADLWLKRGAAYDTLGDYGAALESYRRADQLQPNRPVTIELIGTVLVRTANHRDAIDELSRALALGHQTADTYFQRALAHAGLGEQEKSLADFAKAHELEPTHRRVLIFYAESLHRAGRSEDAQSLLQNAREHDPVGTRIVLAQIYSDRRRDDEAHAAFAEAEALGTDDFLVPWARTMHNLRLGNLADGFRDFDARLRGPLGDIGKVLPGIEWQPASGRPERKLLLYSEQGFGDTIQFVRYVPDLIEQGHEVVLAVQPPLVTLCRSLHPKLRVISRADPIPPFDARAPIPSLPARLGTRLETIPARVPYLQPTSAAREAWQARTSDLNRPRVGLCWSGSSTHERDAARSIPFTKLKPLLEVAGITFVNLQRDPRPDEHAQIVAEKRLVDFTAQLTDFDESAALIEQLDLVITVDTAVAHLAGALNKPAWVLLTSAPDWRWLWDRETTPWYPSARLLRQTTYGDWSDVLNRVAGELTKL
jgi:tetratricopeptide (TPR) repeat protein